MYLSILATTSSDMHALNQSTHPSFHSQGSMLTMIQSPINSTTSANLEILQFWYDRCDLHDGSISFQNDIEILREHEKKKFSRLYFQRQYQRRFIAQYKGPILNFDSGARPFTAIGKALYTSPTSIEYTQTRYDTMVKIVKQFFNSANRSSLQFHFEAK